jgi:hypothetical protein
MSVEPFLGPCTVQADSSVHHTMARCALQAVLLRSLLSTPPCSLLLWPQWQSLWAGGNKHRPLLCSSFSYHKALCCFFLRAKLSPQYNKALTSVAKLVSRRKGTILCWQASRSGQGGSRPCSWVKGDQNGDQMESMLFVRLWYNWMQMRMRWIRVFLSVHRLPLDRGSGKKGGTWTVHQSAQSI